MNGPDVGVAWCPLDTPLITLCDITIGRWLEQLPITNGTIFAYAMNNYWFTNYKAGQDGRFEFRYSITSDEVMDPVAATRHGWQAAGPMRTLIVDAPAPPGARLPQAGSFCRLNVPNVMVTAFKRAEDGNGWIVRLLETGGKKTDATLTFEIPKFDRAYECNLVGKTIKPLRLQDGQLTLAIDAYGIKTVRFAAPAAEHRGRGRFK